MDPPHEPRRKAGRTILIWTGRIAAGLALLAVLFLHGLWVKLHRSLPVLSGSLTLAALEAPAEIVRDEKGVPHIFATSAKDALFAEGFAHAQDRLWQMETNRLFGRGLVSSLFGSMALDSDKFVRALDLAGASERALALMPTEERALLDSYVAGVNAFLAWNTRPLPPEFALLRHKPAPWTAADSVLLLKLMALQLSSNAFEEISNLETVREIGSGGLAALIPGIPSLPAPSTLYGIPDTPPENGTAPAPLPGASNNWVVDGKRSVSGKPLLANDPHLGLGLPGLWYLAQLAFGDESVAGASLAGVPGIILGRNSAIAWGFTNTGTDVQDLYLERLNPQNTDEYATPEGFARFSKRAVTIPVRFGQAKEVTFRATRHGPVLPPDFRQLGKDVPEGYVLAITFPSLADDDQTLAAGLGLLRARNCADFRAAMQRFVAPMQNMVCADKEGHIAFIAPGAVPERKPENTVHGLLPAPGWEAAYDWQGLVPFAELPQEEDPARGYIVTANNRIVAPDYPHFLTYDWESDDRAQRIEQMILARERHDAASFGAMQSDDVSLLAREILPRLLAALETHAPHHPQADEARRLLSTWDGRMAADRPEPLLFAGWVRSALTAILADDLGPLFPRYIGPRNTLLRPLLLGDPALAPWCDDKATPDTEDCPAMLSRAFDDALAQLTNDYGRRVSQWRWGMAHEARFPHGLFGMLLGRKIASGGSWDTVLRGQMRFGGPLPFANVHAATYRAVYDLADPDASLVMITTGQSGNPLSPHYDDLIPLWAAGKYLRISEDRARLLADGASVLRLVPAR